MYHLYYILPLCLHVLSMGIKHLKYNFFIKRRPRYSISPDRLCPHVHSDVNDECRVGVRGNETDRG